MSTSKTFDFFQTEPLNLTGATAIVTGSRRGIGRAIALQLAAEGANIVLNAVSDIDDATEAVMAAIRKTGSECTYVQANIADAEGREALLDTAIETFGQVDILINNAGTTRIADVLEESPEDYDHVMRVNLAGSRFLTQLVTRHMVAGQRSGAVVNILSNATYSAADNRAAYCESKAALLMDTQLFAGRLIEHRIKVNGVVVGIVDTDMSAPRLDTYRQASEAGYFPLMRIGRPEDVAQAAMYAIRCYDTGATIPCCGGVLLSTFNLRTMKAIHDTKV